MASKSAVSRALGILSTSFGGEVTPETLAVYHDALSDLSDEQLGTATRTILRTHEGRFIPPPATIRVAAGANVPPAIDDDAILKRIRDLGRFNPVVGMRWPSVAEVRDALSPEIGDAYANAGGSRLFSNSETTREIARREFRAALVAIALVRGRAAVALPPEPECKALPGSVTYGAPVVHAGFARISIEELSHG